MKVKKAHYVAGVALACVVLTQGAAGALATETKTAGSAQTLSSQIRPFEVPDERSISGTVFFPEDMEPGPDQYVVIEAFNNETDDAEGTVNYDENTGEYTISDLGPTEYTLDIWLDDDDNSGWWFGSGAGFDQEWDTSNHSDDYRIELDLSLENAVDQDVFFSPIGGVSISFANGPTDSIGSVTATNIATNETALLTNYDSWQSLFADESYFEGIFLAGTEFILSFTVNGQTRFDDGSYTGTSNASEATVHSVPLWAGTNLDLVNLSELLTPVEPDSTELTTDTELDSLPPVIQRGATVQITAPEANNGDFVTVWAFSEPHLLSSGFSGSNGAYTFTVPADAPLGEHRLIIATVNGTVLGWQNVTITGTNTPPQHEPETLSDTGSAHAPFIVSAAVLFTVAGVMVALSQRARTRQL